MWEVLIGLAFHLECKHLRTLDLGVGSFVNVRLSLYDLPQLQTLIAPDGLVNVRTRKLANIANLRELILFKSKKRSTWHIEDKYVAIQRNKDNDGSTYAQIVVDCLKQIEKREGGCRSHES